MKSFYREIFNFVLGQKCFRFRSEFQRSGRVKFNLYRFATVDLYEILKQNWQLQPLTLHCSNFLTPFLFIFIFQIFSELITRIFIFKKECQRILRCGTSERMVKAMKKIPANICPAVILHFFCSGVFRKGENERFVTMQNNQQKEQQKEN